ncbi:hypothetical protein Pfo_009970 [Paulownia fortunei]|nr:hypothetical protein Pfo_009970 [Paulownia fortunei]
MADSPLRPSRVMSYDCCCPLEREGNVISLEDRSIVIIINRLKGSGSAGESSVVFWVTGTCESGISTILQVSLLESIAFTYQLSLQCSYWRHEKLLLDGRLSMVTKDLVELEAKYS